MDRTVRAALLAGLITFAAIAGLGVFLGFDAVGSVVAGALLALAGGGLIWLAGRRAESFHPVDPDDGGVAPGDDT